METIEGQTFLMSYDKGGSHFHDLHLRDCTFDNGALSMVKHPKRMSRVRNLRLSQCSAINSMIKPCVFEDVLVEDLSTNPILLVGLVLSPGHAARQDRQDQSQPRA